jgi:glycosyltransferase involved in cell wall biosynthesis
MKLLFIIDSFFPYGVAISSRARILCRLFKEIGYDVHVISLHTDNASNLASNYDLGYCTYSIVKGTVITSIESFTQSLPLQKAIRDFLEKQKVDLIFSTTCSMDFNALARIAKAHNIPYFVEQCEWLDISSFKFGKFDPRFLKMNQLMNGGYKKARGVISISRLLDEHYRSIGIPSIRIPTILDVGNTPYSASEHLGEKINIVYTGNPGVSKEFLRPVIENLVKDKFKKIVFHIYGPTREGVLANIGGDEQLLRDTKEDVIIHGKVAQTEIESILMKADYQLFVRPNRRSSNAGFPTKLGESMAVGTPVIANDTGDICLYLKDGENGFVIDGNSTESVERTLDKVINMNASDYASMRKTARETAENSFDYRRYKGLVSDFFST